MTRFQDTPDKTIEDDEAMEPRSMGSFPALKTIL